ncbi:MAG: HAD family hydrolase [Actinomycetota bacterium]|nr:HAD family hydrolase [Actinomycetota bacterium]
MPMLAILDIDGTLVDTNYHHTIAWYRAFRQHEIVLPIWRIHRHIGMGGDQMVQSLTDERTEREQGEEIRATESVLYSELIHEVSTMDGSRELIEELGRRGHKVVFASSAKAHEVEHYLDLLDARELADGWTTSADVEETKPEPDLVQAALERGEMPSEEAVMVGDTPWDVKAAGQAGVKTIAVLTGGFGEEELRDAGAAGVFESVRELCSQLDRTPLS